MASGRSAEGDCSKRKVPKSTRDLPSPSRDDASIRDRGRALKAATQLPPAARERRDYHDPVPTFPPPGRDALTPWIVLGAVWVTLAIAFGLYFSFPVFFVALLEEFGWSRGATAAAFSLSSIVQGVLSPVIGILVDRFGPRRVILAGTFLLGGACVLSSRIASLWSLYLVTGVLAAAGVGAVGWVPCGALIARWFAHRQGSVMGLAFSGMGVGLLVFGVAADRIGRAPSATLSYACTAAGTLCLLGLETWRHPAPLYAYALLFGLGFGARGPIITAMASELFQGRRFGVIYGILSVGNGLGGALGPWFGGAIHDLTGSYRVAFLITVLLCAMGAGCFWR